MCLLGAVLNILLTINLSCQILRIKLIPIDACVNKLKSAYETLNYYIY